jgi:hypothetical protein
MMPARLPTVSVVNSCPSATWSRGRFGIEVAVGILWYGGSFDEGSRIRTATQVFPPAITSLR